MLKDAPVHTTIPVKDLEEAKKFYGETMGLEQVKEDSGGVVYRSGGSEIFVYVSSNAGTNQGTCASWKLDNPQEAVEALKAKGVNFEHYDDMEGVTREGEVHIMGSHKAAWFKDPSGNILCVGNAM
jgi:catechol 2,3-dioxygenase-like lactoylglutathione lyase family enzyme